MAGLDRARITIPQLADLLGVSRAWVGQCQKRGVLTRTDDDGRVQLGANVRRYLAHVGRARGDDGKGELVAEQTRKLKLANDQLEENLVDCDLAVELVRALLRIVEAELATFSARPPAGGDRIEQDVAALLDRIRSTMESALAEVFGAVEDEIEDEAA
jgi:hypothetical protein